jgi:hypothetical protein
MKTHPGSTEGRPFFFSLKRALKRAILFGSDGEYVDQLAGGDGQYWNEAIAAQEGWSQETPGAVEGQAKPQPADVPEDRERPGGDGAGKPSGYDVVQEASEESFPSSDPPGWIPLTSVGGPAHAEPEVRGQKSEVRSQRSMADF